MSEAVIEVVDLVKEYDGFRAVDGINLSVPRGIVFGLLGPNGAGKTTTIECIVGLRRPSDGSVRVLGVDPLSDRVTTTRKVAVQPQSASMFEHLTVAETVRLFASFHEDPRDREPLLAEMGLTDSADTRVGKLSGGQSRRLLLAIALVGNPEVVVLDEPSAGLDPAARKALWEVIRGLRLSGRTVLLSTHHMDEAAELCDQLAIVVDGRIAERGSPKELIRRYSDVSTVAFSVSGAMDSARLEAIVETEPESVVVKDDRLEVRVQTDDPDGIIRRLTFAPEARVRDISVERKTLEDVFLQVSSREEDGRREGTKGAHRDRRQRP